MLPPDNGVGACVSNRHLHLIVMPTEGCNFRCTYCYESFQQGRMSRGIERGIRSLLTRRASGLDNLRLSWFGGEPLLARDIVMRIQAHAKRLATVSPGMMMSADMTTNGYLLSRSLLAKLAHLGIRSYQITLDGMKDDHDRMRLRADGRATFDRIWSNILASRDVEESFEISIRLHVDRTNIGRIPLFLREYEREFKDDPRYSLLIRPLSRLGGVGDSRVKSVSRRDKERLAAILEKRGQRLVDPGDRRGSMGICYAAKGNSFVVRADGRLNKCTVALEAEENQIGRLQADGSVDIDGGKAAYWLRGLWTGEDAVLACPR